MVRPGPRRDIVGAGSKIKRFGGSQAGFRLSSFCIANKVFKIFEKSVTHFILSLISVKKIATFGTSYFKSHVNMVISKIAFPNPNLTLNFKTHKNVGGNFL